MTLDAGFSRNGDEPAENASHGPEVITYGEFNRVSHYTANLSAAADCFQGQKQAASVTVRSLGEASYANNLEPRHRGGTAGMVPRSFHKQRRYLRYSLRTDHRLGNSKNDIVQRTCDSISGPDHGGGQEYRPRLHDLGHQKARWQICVSPGSKRRDKRREVGKVCAFTGN